MEVLASPDAVAAASDIVSVHLALSKETRGLIGPDFFAAMKPGAMFLNTARGEVVDYAALESAVRERLQRWEEEEQRATRAERLARLQMRVDADLVLKGPDLRRARAELDGRGHLWLSQEDRDLSLARDPFAVRLEDGDLLLMDPPTQHHWQHALPPRARVVAERLNLTFRVIRQP